eukprot:jgi/Undpi1/14117/HiC_scaffold_9.g03768.m1
MNTTCSKGSPRLGGASERKGKGRAREGRGFVRQRQREPAQACHRWRPTVVLAERQWGASGGTLGRAVEGVELRLVQALDPIAETRWPRGVEVGVERAGGEGGSSCAHRKFSALSGVCLVFTPPPPPPPSEQAKTSPFDEDSGNVPCVAQDDLPAVAQLLTFRHLFEAHEAVFPTLEDGAATAPSTPYTKRNHKRAEKEGPQQDASALTQDANKKSQAAMGRVRTAAERFCRKDDVVPLEKHRSCRYRAAHDRVTFAGVFLQG